MKHIAEVLEITFSNCEAPRPVSQLLQVQAKFLQRPLFVQPKPAAAGQACAARAGAGAEVAR